MDRYEKWRQAHPDGVDMDTTPNVRTQQLANENAARARAQQESRMRDEEAARAARQLKEQERQAAEEASRWVQQRQHLEQEARRQEMAAPPSLKSPLPPKVLPQPPDLSFSRPIDNVHGIARRQYESEEVARVTRQGLPSPNLPYPPNSASSANSQQTFSLFPTHLGASSSTVPKSMFYPTAVQYPKLGPTAMPLESPHYEGDSTDSESLNQDFRRLRMDSDNQRSPLKPVRKYVPIYN